MARPLLLTVEYPPDKGGVGRYLESIVKEISGTEVIRPKFFKFFWPRWLKSLLIPFRAKPNKLWISHILPLGYVSLVYKMLTGTPYTIFVHGTDLKFANKNWWKRFWAGIILNQADQIIANSQYTLSLVERLKIKNSKLKIIYPCPTLDPSATIGHKKLFSILSVGRLVPRKGYDQGIKAIVELKKSFPNLSYTIIGNGREQEKLEDLIIKNNANAYIQIIADATDETLKQYYAQSEILLAPGVEIKGDVEGFGLVILEAAQFGTTAIATNVGGVGEAVKDGETGILLIDNSTGNIIEAVNKLLKNDELRRQMGRNAKQRVEREFSMKKQISKITNF